MSLPPAAVVSMLKSTPAVYGAVILRVLAHDAVAPLILPLAVIVVDDEIPFAIDCSVGCWCVSVRCWYVPRWGDCSIRCHVASGRYPKSLAPSIYVNFRSTWEAVFGIWGRHPYTHHRRTAFRASHSEHPCRLSSRVLWYERQMSLVRYLL